MFKKYKKSIKKSMIKSIKKKGHKKIELGIRNQRAATKIQYQTVLEST